jgi:hypothetical protein
MAATVSEVLKVDLVLVGIGLIKTPEELSAFRSAVGSDVMTEASLTANIPSGITEPSRSLAMNRERITLDFSPSRSVIRRDYPSLGDLGDLARLAQVAWLAISNTDLADQKPRAFGYNIELIYDQDSGLPAFLYLADRLFASASFVVEGGHLIGGAGRLIFEGGGKRWTIAIEPRFNDNETTRIFLTLNLHRSEQRLPDEKEIYESLQEAWEQACSFVNRLDARER